MRIKTAVVLGLLLCMMITAGVAGISCSNADSRPMDGVLPMFTNPLPRSPVGLIISDPVFRQLNMDPLTLARYEAAALTPLTVQDLWGYFTGATSRIDIVGTRITNPDMVARLLAAANRGVQVNIVCDLGFFSDPDASKYISQLTQSGQVTIKTDTDGVARQVHSCYAIIDDHRVLSSSGDFLDSTFKSSVNNILVIDTPRTYVNGSGAAGVTTITDAFLFDFDQMFNQGRFGGSKERLINHTFNIGSQVEVYFGPNDNLLGEMVDEVNNMNQSLGYMIGQVTDSTVLGILAAFAFAGFYDGYLNPNYSTILDTGVPFTWPGYNILNHKIMVIDVPVDISDELNPVLLSLLDPVCISGSANWTQAGLTINDEQMLVVHDLTLGYELGFVEFEILNREALGYGTVFGKMRTSRNVPIADATVLCDSMPLPGGVFQGDGGIPTETTSVGNGSYYMVVPSGFVRNIRVEDLGDAGSSYLLPLPIWGEDQPNEGYNLYPGASYRIDFYAQPQPTTTGTGSGGGGGGFGG